jgi:hypothetical protein
MLLALSWLLPSLTAVASIHVRLTPFITRVMLVLAAPIKGFVYACDWVGRAMGVSWITVFGVVMVAVVALKS